MHDIRSFYFDLCFHAKVKGTWVWPEMELSWSFDLWRSSRSSWYSVYFDFGFLRFSS